MSDLSKKIFLTLCVIVPFLAYCAYYYAHVFKNAPYKFTEFKSFTIKYGSRDSMLNSYNSATGEYDYLDKHDSLVKKQLPLKRSELLYLHRKAGEIGFWDFPSNEMTVDTAKDKSIKPLRYDITFNYQRKSKEVIYDVNYEGEQKLIEANGIFIKEIQKVLDEAEARQKK